MINQLKHQTEINLIEVFGAILKYKLLIFTLVTVFGITGYIVSENKPQRLKILLEIKKPTKIDFRIFQFLDYGIIEERPVKTLTTIDLKDDFFNNLKNDIFSSEKFNSIIKKNIESKSFLKNEDGDLSEYLNMIDIQISNASKNSFDVVVSYPDNVNGHNVINYFITELVHLNQNKVKNQIKDLLSNELKNITIEKKILTNKNERDIKNSLFFHQQALKISTQRSNNNNYKLQLEDVSLSEYLKDLHKQDTGFLKAQIINLEERLKNLDKRKDFNNLLTREESIDLKLKMLGEVNFNWMRLPISLSDRDVKKISNKRNFSVVAGLLFGFILSLLIIFTRFLLKTLRN